jgi:hypothetical protein
MIVSTDAVQTNGLGSWLWASMYPWIAVTNSPTPPNEPRRIARLVSWLNQTSIKFSQEEPVGTKWRWKRGRLESQALTLGCP